MLTAISPIDGRYADRTSELQQYFSEFALIKYRVWVETQYFVALCNIPLPQLKNVTASQISVVQSIAQNFTIDDAKKIKDIERTTNHDVKAVEYFIKQQFSNLGLDQFKEFVHFGLTSQDINNTAFPAMIRDALTHTYLPALDAFIEQLRELAQKWADIPMLARTHGQPASPTRLGKEILVFVERLEAQRVQLVNVPHSAKFGGATGNFNAHLVAYPSIDWEKFAQTFVETSLHLTRTRITTQIEHYDNLAALLDAMRRVNTILIDFCRDVWTYISMEYFKQAIKPGEVGSSAMPHKVNPIDFENAEGNLGLANAVLQHLAGKLPISRLQRDLTDSTVMRNVGLPFAYALIALKSLKKGVNKLIVNELAINQDLQRNPMVVAEALQTILRREGFANPYEALKQLTRTNTAVSLDDIHRFIDNLDVSDSIKAELKAVTPTNYCGVKFI